MPSETTPGTASASPAATPTRSLVASPTPSRSPEPTPSPTPSPSAEVLYSCGDEPGFPPSALDAPTGAEKGDDAPAEALRRFLETPEGESLPDAGWRVLFSSDEEVVFAAEPGTGPQDPGEDEDTFPYVEVEDERGTWKAVDAGQCRPTAFFEGLAPASWTLAGDAPPDDAREIDVLVHEMSCSSGHTAEGRIRSPRVAYRDESVTITFAVEPLPPSQDCQASPPTPYTVELDEPLAGRKLLDGVHYPPSPPAAP